jgi:pimeloyl-ACP methyl ester carboxylesterase
MGGAVALRYALDAPEAVRALVLSGTGASFAIPEELLEQTRRVTEGKERRQFSREVWSPATPPEVVRKGIMEEIKTDPRVLYGDLLACNAWSAEDEIASIALPTLVLVGEDDMDWLREQSDLLASRIPGARKVVIPKAGHRALIEQPEAVGGLES